MQPPDLLEKEPFQLKSRLSGKNAPAFSASFLPEKLKKRTGLFPAEYSAGEPEKAMRKQPSGRLFPQALS
jgi:hypothetical protein